MAKELTKAQKSRLEVRAMLMRFVDLIDDIEEQTRVEKVLGVKRNESSECLLLMFPLALLQMELNTFG
ncbi:hypothetical protein LCGC14_1921500, partial [marine sediment metagenome]